MLPTELTQGVRPHNRMKLATHGWLECRRTRCLQNNATGSWRTKSGAPGLSRYVDVYVRAGDDCKKRCRGVRENGS
jgi:hypothetical protein